MKNDFICEIFFPENFSFNASDYCRQRNLSNAINRFDEKTNCFISECWEWSWWLFQDEPN